MVLSTVGTIQGNNSAARANCRPRNSWLRKRANAKPNTSLMMVVMIVIADVLYTACTKIWLPHWTTKFLSPMKAPGLPTVLSVMLSQIERRNG